MATPPHVLAVATHKGGVGKTTTAVNLGRVLARDHRRRVLAVDLDPQGDLSEHVGLLEPPSRHTRAGRLLLGLEPAHALVREAFGMDVISSGKSTSAALSLLEGRPEYLTALGEGLEGGPWDVVLLDTPPSHTSVLQAALRACTAVLLPLSGTYYSLKGFRELLDTIEAARPYAPRLAAGPEAIAGWFVTGTKLGTTLAQQVLDAARHRLAARELSTVIRDNVRLAEAPGWHKPVIDYAPDSPGAADYLALAGELVAKGIV